MAQNNIIKFGIPGGALEETTAKLFRDAGYDLKIKAQPLAVVIDDPEIDCFFDHANEIAILVGRGVLDAGLVSRAALTETKPDIVEVSAIGTPSAEWEETKVVLAVPEKSAIKTIKDLEGKKIITRLPEITKEFLAKNKISAVVEFSSGPNEAKVPVLADAVVEFVNTGVTMRCHYLKPIAVLLEKANIMSIVANPQSVKDQWKQEKIENLALLLKGARLAQEMVGLMLHASNDMLEEVFKILPALKKPTVTHLRAENWFDIFTVAKEKEVRNLIPKLKKIGCTDIVEFPLNKVIT